MVDLLQTSQLTSKVIDHVIDSITIWDVLSSLWAAPSESCQKLDELTLD